MKLKYFACFLVLIMFISCSKDIEVNEPDFAVETGSTTFKVNEEIVFTFKGSANYVSFYSGEDGNNYKFKEGRDIDVENEPVFMNFTSSVQVGSQADQLSVLSSTDFNGDYTSLESLKAANWTDITDRFALGTTATFLSSGNKEISDLMEPGKPIYIAFKYVTRPQADHGLVRTWMIQSFNITSAAQFNNQPISLSDQILAGFRIVDEDSTNTPARSLVTSTRVTLRGNIYKNPADPIYDPENPIFDPENPIYDPESPDFDPNAVRPIFEPYDYSSPYNDPLRENWAVSAPIYASSVNLGADLSIPIKDLRSGKLTEYTYTFAEPGTYEVYFVAINESVDMKKEIVRSITLTITE